MSYSKKPEMAIKNEGKTIYSRIRAISKMYFPEYRMKFPLQRQKYSEVESTRIVQGQKMDIKAYCIMFKYYIALFEGSVIPKTFEELKICNPNEGNRIKIQNDVAEVSFLYNLAKQYVEKNL